MTQDEIIEMAKQADMAYENDTNRYIANIDDLQDFAKLVAAKEREACIVDIQMHIPRSGRDTVEYKMAMRMIERIRARG